MELQLTFSLLSPKHKLIAFTASQGMRNGNRSQGQNSSWEHGK
uniref:Uncharacterized protein n=1 Tax=Arundo donax TaxID=35708 RepID=A0A0A8YGR3_ARUDO